MFRNGIYKLLYFYYRDSLCFSRVCFILENPDMSCLFPFLNIDYLIVIIVFLIINKQNNSPTEEM